MPLKYIAYCTVFVAALGIANYNSVRLLGLFSSSAAAQKSADHTNRYHK